MQWIKKRFDDADHAVATISVAGLVAGVVGFALVVLGVVLSSRP